MFDIILLFLFITFIKIFLKI